MQGIFGALSGAAGASNSDYEQTNALLRSIGEVRGYVGPTHIQQQQYAAQQQLNAMAMATAYRSSSTPEEDRLARMVKVFDWNRAFDLRYFDWFFAQFPEAA